MAVLTSRDFHTQEAFGLGSWIVFGLLLVAMIVSFWERRSNAYLLGAVAVLAGAIPLLAGQFETQIATATAWRWLAAMFLLLGSIAIWSRRKISERLGEGFVEEVRALLFGLTILPLLTPDKLRCLANHLLLATTRPDQRLHLRRATRGRGNSVDWSCSARAHAELRFICGRFLQCDDHSRVPARSRFGPGLDGSHRSRSSRATECDHARSLFAAVAEHATALAISAGPAGLSALLTRCSSCNCGWRSV